MIHTKKAGIEGTRGFFGLEFTINYLELIKNRSGVPLFPKDDQNECGI